MKCLIYDRTPCKSRPNELRQPHRTEAVTCFSGQCFRDLNTHCTEGCARHKTAHLLPSTLLTKAFCFPSIPSNFDAQQSRFRLTPAASASASASACACACASGSASESAGGGQEVPGLAVRVHTATFSSSHH